MPIQKTLTPMKLIVSLLRTVMAISSSPAPGQDAEPPRYPSRVAPLFP
jgi:hypothetical protein